MNDSLRIAKTVTIHTDGACKGNPGPGGWGAVLQYGETRRTIKGGELATTNNRMEMKAAIEALTALKQHCSVVLRSEERSVGKECVRTWRARGSRDPSHRKTKIHK